MSTAVEQYAAASPSTFSTILARRGVLTALAIGWLLVAIGAGLLLATSDHLVDPIAYGIQRAAIIVGWSSAALYWLVRRPGNRLGLAFVALALASVVMSLQGASDPLLHSIGVFGDFPSFVLAYFVIFAFPHGRLAGTPERLLLAGWVLWFLPFFPSLLFSPVVSGGGPIAGCNEACPTNAFMIAARPTIADAWGTDTSYVLLAVGAATLAVLFYRLATATRPRRRALIPVYVPAVMLTVPVLIFHGVVGDHLDVDPSTISDVGWFLSVGRALLPYGFVLSIVVSTFFAATALKKIVTRLVENPSASQLRTTLADALDDPSLELGFRLEQAGGFVDSVGDPLASTPPAGQSSTPVTRNGETAAVIVHDAALDTDPELVAAAGQALLLAIENGRLTAELESTSTELRAARARIVATGDAERRKIERDLHDGAQQHLIALKMRVGLAREFADPEVSARLDDVGEELDEILEELRDLAHGLYPPELRQFGLREALTSLVRRSASQARVEAAAIGRYSEEVETAVYFCCAESLQNVDKHAGSGVTAVIRIWESDGRLYFEIFDDGVGYHAESARDEGHGLANVAERIAAHGGTLVVESAPGRGTTLRASIPVADAATHRVGPADYSGPEGRRG